MPTKELSQSQIEDVAESIIDDNEEIKLEIRKAINKYNQLATTLENINTPSLALSVIIEHNNAAMEFISRAVRLESHKQYNQGYIDDFE